MSDDVAARETPDDARDWPPATPDELAVAARETLRPDPLTPEGLQAFFMERGWVIVMDDRPGQSVWPWDDLSAALRAAATPDPAERRYPGAPGGVHNHFYDPTCSEYIIGACRTALSDRAASTVEPGLPQHDIEFIVNCIPWERADLRDVVRAALTPDETA